MAIRTPDEYKNSLRDGRIVFHKGEQVFDVTVHPSLKVAVEHMAQDYVFSHHPKFQSLVTYKTDTGELASFNFKPTASAQDLLRRRQIIQTQARALLGQQAGARFGGADAFMAATLICKRMDRVLGTKYSQRVEAYREHLQKEDLAIAVALMDVKGDRSLRPSEQKQHQDYYLRIVDRKKDGIVVRGAKAHITRATCTNELVVLPCRAMREVEKDYAVAFAVPVNAPGLAMIASHREPIQEGDYASYPITASENTAEALIVFDDVFVPWERVFLAGEHEFAAQMVHMFANFHRLSADAYKYVELEILAGAAALMAEYNGIEGIAHVKDKLSWLSMYVEGTDALGKLACMECVTDESGMVYPNPMYSNIAKLFFADNFHQAVKHLQDIAGGIAATVPDFRDFLNPQTRPILEKYLSAKDGIPAEHRIRAVNLVKDISSSWHSVTTLHAEGSLAAQRLSIYALADIERYKSAARRAARIHDGSKVHPAYTGLPGYLDIK
ncbi:MAG: 4-hydroxyphenylacetate 3-hydroxylase N-terminal domain-containing protein [Dehalococcoidia bacterium]|nr:4-hydroxyphenylacetate 3-hydroxylase N-terminal domain-containing protein [Dehalococcoidia bacterium]